MSCDLVTNWEGKPRVRHARVMSAGAGRRLSSGRPGLRRALMALGVMVAVVVAGLGIWTLTDTPRDMAQVGNSP